MIWFIYFDIGYCGEDHIVDLVEYETKELAEKRIKELKEQYGWQKNFIVTLIEGKEHDTESIS